ncbi:MAG: DUF192 domain-containing protein [Parcubacteria group bacterium]|nr:DUF192 domain-containing protein [Parcubacteria group bacterium]
MKRSILSLFAPRLVIYFFTLAGIFVILIAGIQAIQNNADLQKWAIVSINNATFISEIADTRLRQAQGLSGRESMSQNQGMLFVFNKEIVAPFWMNKMKFPIDIIWIDKDKKIVDIVKDAPIPLNDTSIPIFMPASVAQYVLEIAVGMSERYGFKVGDEVEMTPLNN